MGSLISRRRCRIQRKANTVRFRNRNFRAHDKLPYHGGFYWIAKGEPLEPPSRLKAFGKYAQDLRMEVAVETWFGGRNGSGTSRKGELGADPYASTTNRIWERRLVLCSKVPVSEPYRISFVLDAVAAPKDQQGKGQRKSRPRIQVTSLQPCVDLRQVCVNPTELWQDA